MASETQTSKVGRPVAIPAKKRRELILDAMERVIARRGVRGASMAAIAREAAMSKRTLYTVFENRDAMFGAWVQRLRASAVRPLSAEDSALPISERLKKLLRREAQGAALETRLRVLRALIAESEANPQLVAAFAEQGPDAARAIIADELARAAATGELTLIDIPAAARLLLDMVHAPALEALLNSNLDPLSVDEAENRLDLAISVFLGGVGREAPARS